MSTQEYRTLQRYAMKMVRDPDDRNELVLLAWQEGNRLGVKSLDMTKPFSATLENAWDYLGADENTLPTNARSLIMDIDIKSQARQDTLGKSGENVFGASSFRFDGVKDSQTLPLLSSQPGVPGRKVIDVSQLAGQAITLRMVGAVSVAVTEPVVIGIGDVYINRKPLD